MGYSALAQGAGSLIGGIMSSGAASSASNAQSAAYQQALNFSKGIYNTASTNLSPFISTGQGAENQLATLTGAGPGGNPLTAALTKQFNPSDLANTPGYQFSLNQGLKATQNQLAASGLGSSGQATAGAANYAEGLAGTTYNQQLQNYLAQNQQTYNMLNGIAQGGQSAAGTLGSIGTNVGQQVGNAAAGQGNAQAAGILGSNNALVSGINGAVGAYNQNNILNYLQGQGQSGGSGFANTFNTPASQFSTNNALLQYLPGV